MWVEYYLQCFELYKKYKQSSIDIKKYFYLYKCTVFDHLALEIKPSFLTNEFCNQHKKRLVTKAPSLYMQFIKYGTSLENWYYVNGKLVKYYNGKIIQ